MDDHSHYHSLWLSPLGSTCKCGSPASRGESVSFPMQFIIKCTTCVEKSVADSEKEAILSWERAGGVGPKDIPV
jgi:hypothetical protein